MFSPGNSPEGCQRQTAPEAQELNVNKTKPLSGTQNHNNEHQFLFKKCWILGPGYVGSL